ncbi:MAG TPA: methionine--tRNA ligase, partial [Anaerolineae bacterium]
YTGALFGEQSIQTIGADDDRHEVLLYDTSSATGAWKPSTLQPGQLLGGEPKGLVAKIEVEKV